MFKNNTASCSRVENIASSMIQLHSNLNTTLLPQLFYGPLDFDQWPELSGWASTRKVKPGR